MQQDIQQRKNLDEVSFIRPILIVLLVLYHAFAPWCGSWKPFDGFQDNEVYWWIGKLAYSFMLPTFVFISGYVWAYQREGLNKKDKITTLANKKFRRLYIPSLVFSLLYLPLLSDFPFGGGVNLLTTSVLKVIQGSGHMWFLPMLFWCFILCFLILRIESKVTRAIVVCVSVVLSILPIPLQIGPSLYYVLYFYFGYEMWCRNESSPVESNYKRIVIAWLIFFISFFLLTEMVRSNFVVNDNSPLMLRVKSFYLTRICSIIFSISGLYAIYISSLKFVRTHKISKWIIDVGSLCFGIYLLQQFILQILYYHTGFSKVVDNNYMPWIGFVIALCVSAVLSLLLRKTSWGRKLI